MKNAFKTAMVFLIAVSIFSCEKESEEPLQETELTGKTCSDGDILDYLSTCQWVVENDADSSVNGLSMDFSNMNIHVRDAENNVVEEGNWAIEEGILTFNSLNEVMADYSGEWSILECSTDYFKIKKGDLEIGLKKDCDE